MEKLNNTKLLIGLFYLLLLFIFLFVLFSKFNIQEITTYKFIQDNTENLNLIKESNKILLTVSFIIFVTIWVFMLGFASPIALLGGFIFGQWIGTFLAAISLSTGATLLYIFGNYFLKDFIKKKFLSKFKNLESKLRNNEFIFFLIYRLVGGIPFQIANLIPVIFSVKLKNYFLGSFLGILPQIFIFSSLGSGIEKIIKNNESVPSISQLLYAPEIYLPISGFIFLLITTIIVKKLFFNS